MVGVAFLQSLKHHIHRRLKFRVVLAGLAGIYHFKQRREVHFFLRRFLPDIADQGRVEQPFRFHPKIFRAFFALALGVADQGVYQLQHVFFRVQIPKRVVFHALGKVDGVQHFHAVAAADKELAHFTDQAALGVCYNKRGRIVLGHALHKVRLYKEPGLAAAAASDHQNIFIPGGLGVFRPVVHRQPFRLCQQNVVVKIGVDIGGYILGAAPSGAAVLHAFAVFLGVLALAVHHEPQRRSTGDADQQVKGVEAGGGIGKGRRAAVRKVQELLGKVDALRQPVRLSQLAEQIDKQQIGQVGDYQLFHSRLHRDIPLSLNFSLARSALRAAAFSLLAAISLRIEGRSSRCNFLAVNSLNACSMLSASLALKITM